jgi:hypothetical protein
MTQVATDAPGPEQVVATPTEAELTEMVDQIKENSLQISDVPVILHEPLFPRLQIAKNEAVLACQRDLSEHLSDAIWALQLTSVMPDKTQYRTERLSVSSGNGPRLTRTTPFVAAFFSQGDPGSDIRRLEAELKAAERFWQIEEERLTELRSAALNALSESFQSIVLPRDPTERNIIQTERDCQMVDLQRTWVARASDLHARKEREIGAIRRQIEESQGIVRSPRATVRKVSFRSRKVRPWRLFTPDDEIHEELGRHKAIIGRGQHSLLAAGFGVSYSRALRPRIPDGQPTGTPRRRLTS